MIDIIDTYTQHVYRMSLERLADLYEANNMTDDMNQVYNLINLNLNNTQ